ncbi:DNA polymerase III subunit chi [Neptunicoccus cionae]|uniref:DNA polymerase III subunit chi n=1 Tax=Neptunicoccus cionae TaxID=2035344 RepID=A0A916R0Z0_9RHOB|nr:DNA polymerase III subunit chi [Amylibacter cionae]GGA24713.1 DNA polymerase III subunit chi [Amylibacter cionae]
MAEVFFYHLTRSRLEQALPDLLEKVRAKPWRALVRGREEGKLQHLDAALWQYREESFLPHGIAGGPNDSDQPILLTLSEDNPNNAEILLLTDGAKTTAEEVARYARVCLMFDGNNTEELTAAREDWKALTGAGIAAQYWAQEDGRWIKKAEKAAS